MNLKIGTIIKQLRQQNNVTQEQLATALYVSPQAISRWESEICYPDIEFLPALADFFSVSTDELLGYKLSERARIEMIKNNENPYFVKELETGYVVLGDHQRFKGYTLFLCKKHVTELHHLDHDFKIKYLEEMSLVAEAVQNAFGAEKMNYELLGNGDTHLHWHLFPRNTGDTPEKGPVWWLPKEEIKRVSKTKKTYDNLIQMGIFTEKQLEEYVHRLPEHMWSMFDTFMPMVVPKYSLEEYSLNKGDMIVICCDGVSDYLNSNELVKLIDKDNLSKSVEQIIDTAKDNAIKEHNRNQYDDITIVLYHY